MRKPLFIPDAMVGVHWKAVCSETGLYSLGRGQRKRAAKYLAGALLHLVGGAQKPDLETGEGAGSLPNRILTDGNE